MQNRAFLQIGLLVGICVIDLISTVWLVLSGHGDEANPLMAFFLAQGILAFIGAKLCLVAAPVATLEWARKSRPALVSKAYAAAVAGYIGMYVVGVANANTVREPYELKIRLEEQRSQAWAQVEKRLEERKAKPQPFEIKDDIVLPEKARAQSGLIAPTI